jgi:hypothetical protein
MSILRDTSYQWTHIQGFHNYSRLLLLWLMGIPRLVASMLQVNILLTMAKDIGGIRPIVICEVFF